MLFDIPRVLASAWVNDDIFVLIALLSIRSSVGRGFGEAAGLVGLFFGIFGIFGIFQPFWWAIVAYRPGNRPLIILGILAFTFSILIYLLATVTPLPLGVPQLRINQFPLLTKVLELIYIIGSISTLTGEK